MRDIKMLQRAEMKEASNFYNKITAERDNQEKKFDLEQQVKLLNYIIYIITVYVIYIYIFIYYYVVAMMFDCLCSLY